MTNEARTEPTPPADHEMLPVRVPPRRDTTVTSQVSSVFTACVEAIRDGKLITRESKNDKEFHFQNWFQARLETTGIAWEAGGRNSYPDFRLVKHADGFEVKGLAYPGRWTNYDSNSQVPTGWHNERNIYYVFGRYPAKPDGNTYAVVDLVVCHGDFLNAHHEYVHKNKNVKGFGTYGDIMIRDRKMYVAPTPYGLLEKVADRRTLILPFSTAVPAGFVEVGEIVRKEVAELVVGYSFNLRTNEMSVERIANPDAGKEHKFRALRAKGDHDDETVSLRATIPLPDSPDDEDEVEE